MRRTPSVEQQTSPAVPPDLYRALAARLDATLAGRRSPNRILDNCPPLCALTVVVADLAAAARDWTARLGAHGEAPDPAQFTEPGLAQQFALGPCTLILFQPAEGIAADRFLRDHGDGLYATTPSLAAQSPRTPLLLAATPQGAEQLFQ